MCKNTDCSLVEIGHWIDKTKHIFKRGEIGPSSLAKQYLRNTYGNIGIFQTAYTYDIADQNNAYLYGDLYLDFDSKADFEKARMDALYAISYLKVIFKIDTELIKIYYSGNKGIHLIVDKELLGVSPHKKLNYIFKSIAIKLKAFIKNNTLDLQIYDNKRMLRIPNSMHEVSHLYKVPLTYIELRELSEQQIKQIATNPRELTDPFINNSNNKYYQWFVDNYESLLNIKPKNKYKSKIVMKYIPPCMQHILENGAQDGCRNNTTAIVASFFKCRGLTYEEALEKTKEWNELNAPPLSDAEVLRTVYSIYNSNTVFGCSTISNYYSECSEKCKYFNKRGSNESK